MKKNLVNLTIFVRTTNEWGRGIRSNLNKFAKQTLHVKIKKKKIVLQLENLFSQDMD